MDPRAEALRASLALTPHPEGGYYRELYRSPRTVTPDDGRGPRAMLTTIYFLLPAGAISRWHRVGSDEVWHHLEGDPLEVLALTPARDGLVRHRIGPLRDGHAPEHVVPAGEWQAARSLGAYSLVGCVVGPGFTFEDFELLRDRPDEAGGITRLCREAADFV